MEEKDKLVVGPRWWPDTRSDWLTVGREKTLTSKLVETSRTRPLPIMLSSLDDVRLREPADWDKHENAGLPRQWVRHTCMPAQYQRVIAIQVGLGASVWRK
jgi:hypothetical protein